ncbi:HIT family protein [Saccharopolyspora soli]|uniref:HIT family protein n=1 Tax=Saccharopolyspora soli TaxID=2926618 RepID=UPI001F56CFAF|nr:hypothetical protein [Saccharopolyspora soli]
MNNCVFCDIVTGEAPATFVRRWRPPWWSARRWIAFLCGDRHRREVVAIRPRGGVNDGHLLVIPRTHVVDASVDPAVSARTMACAAELMGEHDAANIITSRGTAATQTFPRGQKPVVHCRSSHPHCLVSDSSRRGVAHIDSALHLRDREVQR